METYILGGVYTGAKGLNISNPWSKQGGQVVKGWPSSLATEFDGLSVLRLIGEGSVTTVFLAREMALERLVSLKVLKAEFASDAVMRERFRSKALTAASVVHPNIAAIYRVGARADGLPYIAQEYIGGRSLADLLRSSEVRTVDESVRIVASLAKAFAAVEAKRIVHGNVNPEEVLIEQDSGRVVLTNFGIAGLQEKGHAVETHARSDEVLGDSRYTASDVFSLGVLAYELLIGRGPYEGSVTLDLKSERSDVSEELAQLLRRCVDKVPDARPTAEELVRQLTKDERTETPLGPMQLTQRAVESSLMRTAVISGVVFMAMGAALALWLFVKYS